MRVERKMTSTRKVIGARDRITELGHSSLGAGRKAVPFKSILDCVMFNSALSSDTGPTWMLKKWYSGVKRKAVRICP